MENYPYITKWGRMMGSFDYFIENEIRVATKDGAPQNATYKCGDVWRTTDDITNLTTRREILGE